MVSWELKTEKPRISHVVLTIPVEIAKKAKEKVNFYVNSEPSITNPMQIYNALSEALRDVD